MQQPKRRQLYNRRKSRCIREKRRKAATTREVAIATGVTKGVVKQHIRTVEAGFYEGQAFSN